MRLKTAQELTGRGTLQSVRRRFTSILKNVLTGKRPSIPIHIVSLNQSAHTASQSVRMMNVNMNQNPNALQKLVVKSKNVNLKTLKKS